VVRQPGGWAPGTRPTYRGTGVVSRSVEARVEKEHQSACLRIARTPIDPQMTSTNCNIPDRRCISTLGHEAPEVISFSGHVPASGRPTSLYRNPHPALRTPHWTSGLSYLRQCGCRGGHGWPGDDLDWRAHLADGRGLLLAPLSQMLVLTVCIPKYWALEGLCHQTH
jgi:hypothetical protein